MLFARKQKKSEPVEISLSHGDQTIAVELRPNPRARRYILKLDAKNRKAIVTVPKGGSRKQAERFAREQADWIVERLDRLEDPLPFVPDVLLPLRGVEHRLVATGASRGLVKVVAADPFDELHVAGAPDHFGRRVQDYLKSEALKDYRRLVAHHGNALGVQASAIRLRDGKSRWGSCSSNKTLSFSWRLILAPPEVLDYLVAHEVAHLREMNHGAQFWAHVAALCPQYKTHQQWLRTEGTQLWRYGLSDSS